MTLVILRNNNYFCGNHIIIYAKSVSRLGAVARLQMKMDNIEVQEAIFLFATEGILITNEMGGIVKANPSAEKLFGYKKGELIEKKIEVLVPERFHKMHENHRKKFSINPHAREMGLGIELFGKRKDNSVFPVEISLSPFSTDEGRFVTAFIIDITRRKQAEEKLKSYSQELEKEVHNRTIVLRETITELEKTKKELSHSLHKERELNEMKSRFVSTASHEFRTPLATILSSLSLADKYTVRKDEDKRKKHFSRIKSSITGMTEILNDFLSIGKLEEGLLQSQPVDFDIRTLSEEVIQETQTIAKPGQKIVYSHTGKITEGMLDKKLLKHILINLLSNAIKFSEEGEKIELHTELKNSSLTISVKDRGMGISSQDQKHLFERFFRAKNAINIQGTGLGLNIVKKYLELMNGTINFKSKLNEGTTFIINFPQHEKNPVDRRQQ